MWRKAQCPDLQHEVGSVCCKSDPAPVNSETSLNRWEHLTVERRWRSDGGSGYTRGTALHGEIEVFNARGKHLGSIDPITGEMVKPAVPGRTIDV